MNKIKHSFYSAIPMRIERSTGLSRFSMCIALFAMPNLALFSFGYVVTAKINDTNRWIHMLIILSSTWITLGPLLISIWEYNLRRFTSGIMKRLQSKRERRNFHAHVCRARDWLHVIGTIYTIAIIIFFLTSESMFLSLFQIERFDPFYLITAVNLAVISFTTGVGTAGVLITVVLFYDLRKLDLHWEPLHEDGRGGFGFLSYFALYTACAFSCGVVTVPGGIAFAEHSEAGGKLVGWSLVLFYSFCIALSFIVPMSFISFKASACKSSYLNNLRCYIHNLLGDQNTQGDRRYSAEFNLHLESLQQSSILFSYYDRVMGVSVYPFTSRGLLVAVLSSLAPVASLLLQMFLKHYSTMFSRALGGS